MEGVKIEKPCHLVYLMPVEAIQVASTDNGTDIETVSNFCLQ